MHVQAGDKHYLVGVTVNFMSLLSLLQLKQVCTSFTPWAGKRKHHPGGLHRRRVNQADRVKQGAAAAVVVRRPPNGLRSALGPHPSPLPHPASRPGRRTRRRRAERGRWRLSQRRGEWFCLPRAPRYLLRPQRSAHPRGNHRRQLRGAKERTHAWKHLPCSPSERCPRSGVSTAPGV